jgi:hypothetical protein
MVEMLLGLDVNPYSYDDITENPWPFKTRNRGKENEYIQYTPVVFAKEFSKVAFLLR